MLKRLNPIAFPHFMERNSKSYRSLKPLGRIYDRVRTIKFDPTYDMAFDKRILSRFELLADETNKAREVKGRYDIAMRRLIGRHENPVTEFEIWSTFILSKPRVGNDYKLQEEVGRDVAALKDRFRSICGEAVVGATEEKDYVVFSYSMIDLEKLDRFVAAMYTVTHDEVQEALRLRALPVMDGEEIDEGYRLPMPLISFPWLFHKELCRIATGGRPPIRQWKPSSGSDGGQTVAIENNVVTADYKSEPEPELEPESETQVIVSKKEGSAFEDSVRTSSGKVVHRGETLDLFRESGSVSPANGSAVDQNDEEEKEQNDDGESSETEFEEAVMDMDDDEEEDALDALTKKVGGI